MGDGVGVGAVVAVGRGVAEGWGVGRGTGAAVGVGLGAGPATVGVGIDGTLRTRRKPLSLSNDGVVVAGASGRGAGPAVAAGGSGPSVGAVGTAPWSSVALPATTSMVSGVALSSAEPVSSGEAGRASTGGGVRGGWSSVETPLGPVRVAGAQLKMNAMSSPTVKQVVTASPMGSRFAVTASHRLAAQTSAKGKHGLPPATPALYSTGQATRSVSKRGDTQPLCVRIGCFCGTVRGAL